MRRVFFILLLSAMGGCQPKSLEHDNFVFMSENLADELSRCGEQYNAVMCFTDPADAGNELSLLIGYVVYGAEHKLTGVTLGEVKAKAATWKSGKDAEYATEKNKFLDEYRMLGAPKILYICDGRTGYSGGVGIGATYNHILMDVKRGCRDFSVVESQQ